MDNTTGAPRPDLTFSAFFPPIQSALFPPIQLRSFLPSGWLLLLFPKKGLLPFAVPGWNEIPETIHYLNPQYESVPGVMANGWLIHEEKDHIVDIVWCNPNLRLGPNDVCASIAFRSSLPKARLHYHIAF